MKKNCGFFICSRFRRVSHFRVVTRKIQFPKTNCTPSKFIVKRNVHFQRMAINEKSTIFCAILMKLVDYLPVAHFCKCAVFLLRLLIKWILTIWFPDLANTHKHFGGSASCFSCRAFFRRSVRNRKPTNCQDGHQSCHINIKSRDAYVLSIRSFKHIMSLLEMSELNFRFLFHIWNCIL